MTQVTIEQLQKQKLFVGTPCYGGMAGGLFTKSMIDLAALCAKNGIELRTYFLFNESLVPRARNYITDEFLRSDCTHLLFIDADIGFKASDALSLLALQISDPSSYDIVCGPYTKKTIAWEKIEKAVKAGKGSPEPKNLQRYAGDFVLNVLPGTKQFRLDKPVEVLEAGTGFMLIPRSTLEKFKKKYPQLSYKPDHVRTEKFDGSSNITAFFDTVIDPKSKRYLSEDYFFCQYARKAGAKVHICPWMELTHTGSYVFNSTIAAIAELENTSLTS